jgi:hypothetical protein
VPDYPVPGWKNPVARLLLTAALLIRHGRPVRLAAAGWQPASLAVMT